MMACSNCEADISHYDFFVPCTNSWNGLNCDGRVLVTNPRRADDGEIIEHPHPRLTPVCWSCFVEILNHRYRAAFAKAANGMSLKKLSQLTGLYFYRCNDYDDYGGSVYFDLSATLRTATDDEREQLIRNLAVRVSEASGFSLTEVLRRGWRLLGWEGEIRGGDGIVYAMLPPYVFGRDACQDGWWKPVFHVKQDNNGTSFIATTQPMLSDTLAWREMRREYGG